MKENNLNMKENNLNMKRNKQGNNLNKEKKEQNNPNKKKITYNQIVLLPIILIVTIIPCIVRYYSYNTGLAQFDWFPVDDSHFDFFYYYKHLFLLLILTFMIFILLYYIMNHKVALKLPFIFIPLSLYALLVFLSTILSKYRNFGFTGIYEQFESMFALLGYCFIVLYIFYFVQNESSIDKIVIFLTLTIFILSLLGIMQITGHDYFLTDIGMKSIMPRELWNEISSFTFTFDPNRVYLTLYNPNYVGVYVALLLPIYLGLSISTSSRKNKIISIIACIGLLISLIGSRSKAGMISVIVTFLLILLFYRKYIFKKKSIAIVTLSILILSSIAVAIIKYDSIISLLSPKEQHIALTEITTDDAIHITYNDHKLYVNYNLTAEQSLQLYINDENGNKIDSIYDDINFIFQLTDTRFENIYIYPVTFNDTLGINIKIDGRDWLFQKSSDGNFSYINRFGKPDSIVNAESALFNGYETIASYRGYIWSRTIPLLSKHLFLGSGAETFAISYPQQDYVNLYNFSFGDQILTKPHSLYLQIGVQTGVLSLLFYLIFYTMYLISCIRLYFKGNFNTKYERYGIAFFIGTVGYMITGLTNDSTISLAPIYWIIIGLGVMINYTIKSMGDKSN